MLLEKIISQLLVKINVELWKKFLSYFYAY